MANEISEMIERKNSVLSEAAKRLRTIADIADGLERMKTSEDRDTAVQMCKLAGYKLNSLALIWGRLEDESALSLPEAEQEPEGEVDAIEF